ncbi:MAG: rod shape-determining protein MreD [Spirochaetia bacterium]
MLRHFFIALFLLVGFYILQQTVLIKLSSYVWGITPNLAMIFFCLFCIQYGRLGGQVLGFVGGLLQDFFSGTTVCFYALIYLVMGYIFGAFYANSRFNNLQAVPILVTFASILNMILALIIGEIFSINISANFLSHLFWGETIMNIVVGLPLYFVVQFLAKKMGLTASWRRLRNE